MWRRSPGGGRRSSAGALALLLAVAAGTAWAQFGPPIWNGDPDVPGAEFHQLRRLPTDPLAQASLLKAQQAMDSGDVAAGLQTLQEILDQDADFFLRDGSRIGRSLFHEIEDQLLARRDDYERLFGPTAKQLLDQARADQNALQIEEVARRFPVTGAGVAALRELARVRRDQGEPELAARWLEALAPQRSGAERRELLQNAARLLTFAGGASAADGLRRRWPQELGSTAPPATGPLPATFSAADAPIYEWRLPDGDVQHAGRVAPAPALFDDAWQGDLIHDDYDFPQLALAPDVARELARECRELSLAVEKRIRQPAGRTAFPAPRPVIVNGLAIVPGPGSVKAYDLQTGRLEWNGAPIDETFSYLSAQSDSAGEGHDAVREEMRDLFASVRGWRDLTACSLSTDGERAYAISNCQLVGTTSPQRMMQNTQRHALLPQRSNLLTAYDLATDGKKLWSVGTPLEDPTQQGLSSQRELFFYGAPLPVDGRLYVLGEERGQVQLFEIDPATGSILWSLGLLNPDRDLVLDDVRRLAGLMPAYAAGLLICPSGEGSLTAVDPIKRQVVWTHFYAEPFQPLRHQIMMLRNMRLPNQSTQQARDDLLSDQRWLDSRVIAAGPYILFTPPDEDSLICLQLQDGAPVWQEKFPRSQMLYAAGVFEDCAILVGRSELTAIRLADGQAAWKQSVPIPSPSGRGLRMGDQFLQPLATGEIAVIDLRQGRLLTRIALPSGRIPGNLAADQGTLVSQTATGIWGFRSRDWLEQEIAGALHEKPNNSRMLALRGTWELQQGDLKSGLADLKASLAAAPGSTGQSALVWSLLDGLRTDFAAYRGQADGIEGALQGNEQRLQFLRTYALGLQQTGESQAAFDRYLKILQMLPWPQPLHDLDSRWSATDSRWVLARLEELLDSAPPELRARLRRGLADWMRQSDPVTLLRLLPSFSPDWIDPETRLAQLGETPATEQGLHSRDALLRPLLDSADESIRLKAAAQLLTIALRVGDAEAALDLLARLESADISIATLAPKTSRELARSIRANPQYAKLLQSVPVWPRQVQPDPHQPPPPRQTMFQIPLLGAPSPTLAGWTFFVDQAGVNIEIFDPHGRHRTRIPTGLPGVRYAVEADLGRYVSLHNHLALIVLLDRFILLDFLTDPLSPQLIANRQIAGDDEGFYGNRMFMPGQQKPGLRTMLVELRAGRPGSNVGPLTDSILCYSSGRDLVAIDPQTGDELWRRRDIPSGCEIYGDERYIVLRPPEDLTLQILRAADGSRAGTCALPATAINCLQRQGGDWGRCLPVVETDRGVLRWSLFDPAENRTVWTHEAPAGTAWAPVNGCDIAFYSPDKTLQIREGLTGRERFQGAIPVDGRVEQIALLEFPDQWILCTSGSSPDLVRRQSFGAHAHELVLAPVDGVALAIDRETGRIAWKTPVPNQELVTQYPFRWPILLFGRGGGKMDSLILNRFNGESVRKGTSADDGSGISWSTETQPLRIQLKFAQDRVTLNCDGSPLTPPRRPDRAPPQQEPAPRQR